MPVAADKGLTFADPFALILAFVGLAVFAAIAALSHQRERAFSASVIYLGLGLSAALLIELADVAWLEPGAHAALIEHMAEIALIVALFSAGMKIERPLHEAQWAVVARLLLIGMPLSIAAVAAFGTLVMGLGLGAAVVLGAMLAPTDPVLAGDLGVGPPGAEDTAEERESRFALTGEAGLNDGLAFPFVALGLFIAEEDGTGWLGTWLLADVIYATAVGVLVGGAGGYCVAALAVRARDRGLLSPIFDGWLALGAVLVLYSLAEIAGAYGFLAAFAGGMGFGRYERGHEVNRRVHDGAEFLEKLGELAVILLLGSLVTLEGLGAPQLTGWLVVPLLLLVIRPLTVLLALAGCGMRLTGERLFVAWFGVRGIGSLYYAAVVLASGAFDAATGGRLFWVVAACVLVSIVVHGFSSWPLEKRLLPQPAAA